MYSLFCSIANESTNDCRILDVATDQDDSVYVLINLQKSRYGPSISGVWVFDKDNCQSQCFQLRDGFSGFALTVEGSSKRVFVSSSFWSSNGTNAVEVYNKNNGAFICKFVVEEQWPGIQDIISDNDGRVLTLGPDCVQAFNVHGVLLHKWSTGTKEANFPPGRAVVWDQKCHLAGERIVIVRFYILKDGTSSSSVSIYTKECEFVYSIHLNLSVIVPFRITGITVTAKGRIAITCFTDVDRAAKILVL